MSLTLILLGIIFDIHKPLRVFLLNVCRHRGVWGGGCILLSVLTNYLLKLQQMALGFSDIIARLQLRQPGGSARGPVDACHAAVMDTGSCLGFKEHSDLSNESPPSPRFIAAVHRVSIVPRSLPYLQTK